MVIHINVPQSSNIIESHLEAIKGVMSSSRGKDTYVVIFRLSLAECSNRWKGVGGKERGRKGITSLEK